MDDNADLVANNRRLCNQIADARQENERLLKRIAMFERELEDIKVTIGAMLDPDNPPLTEDDFAKSTFRDKAVEEAVRLRGELRAYKTFCKLKGYTPIEIK